MRALAAAMLVAVGVWAWMERYEWQEAGGRTVYLRIDRWTGTAESTVISDTEGETAWAVPGAASGQQHPQPFVSVFRAGRAVDH